MNRHDADDWFPQPKPVHGSLFSGLSMVFLVIILLAFLTGYFYARTKEVVCDDDVAFHPVSELHPDAYAGSYALCGLTPVVVLD